MRSPDAGEAPPAGRLPEIHAGGEIDTESTDAADAAADLWSARQLEHHLRVHRDPERAADDLREQLGGRSLALVWTLEVQEALR